MHNIVHKLLKNSSKFPLQKRSLKAKLLQKCHGSIVNRTAKLSNLSISNLICWYSTVL